MRDERPLSWNRFYAGMHWTKRSDEARRVKALVLAELLEAEHRAFQGPVDITVTAFFKNRPQDPDNICSKVYIDALIGRILLDDGHSHVNSVTTRSRIDKKKPRVEIEIQRAF